MNILLICHHRLFKIFLRPLPMARYLAMRGHSVDLLCIADRDRFKFTEQTKDGVRIVQCPDLFPGKLRSGWDPVCALRRVNWLRRQEKCWDIIQAMETRPATIYPVKWLMKHRPAPLFIDWIDWWGHGGLIAEARPIWYQLLFGRLETYYEEAFRTLADGTVTISGPLRERAIRLGVKPETTHILRNGIPVEAVHASERFDETKSARADSRSRFGIAQNALALMFSSLDVYFDLELVVKAMAHLAPAFPDLQLVIIGQKRSRVAALIARFGLESRVVQLGQLRWEDNVEALRCGDVLALPLRDTVSNRGRWPSKVGDYMAAGRPIVANPIGDVAAVIREAGAGLLVDYDPQRFAEACATLLRDPALREKMGKAGREYARTHLAWDGLVADLDVFYAAVVERWRAKRA